MTVLSRIARSTFGESLRETRSLFVFYIVTFEPRLFQRFVTCMCGGAQSELYSQRRRVIHKEASGRRLLYPAPILLVLFSTFLDQRRRQERPSFHALYLCVTYRCCFFHSKKTDTQKNRTKKKEEVYSDLCGLWQLFEYNRGCFYKLVVH